MQAEKIAERATRLSFETIVASDYVRATATARIISARTNRPLSFSANFREIAHPSSFIGVSHSDPAFQAYQAEKRTHGQEWDWRYANEENFGDLWARAQRAEDELVGHSATSLLVVTHGNFVKFLTGYLIFKESFTPAIYWHIADGLQTSNTGITVFILQDLKWRAISINDHAHLG